MVLLRQGRITLGGAASLCGVSRVRVHQWCRQYGVPTEMWRLREAALIEREGAKMARNFNKARNSRRMAKHGFETRDSSAEVRALLRATGPAPKPRKPKAELKAQGDEAVARFLAQGGTIKRYAP